jgi:regulator of PEP synthase PpsR (kinase-PPPase family)
MPNKRTVFFISDRTGITVEALGQSLLTQFDGFDFRRITLPFIDSVEKTENAVKQINLAAEADGARPVVFSSLVDTAMSGILATANALFLDFFQIFIAPLEEELKTKSSHTVGRSHSVKDNPEYQLRIEAVNFALSHDDGVSTRDLDQADIILVGVSRCGKTPTCLYLALQFGIKAANYPLIPEDLEKLQLPAVLKKHQKKLYGLTIAPQRLQQIRNERKPDSKYAALSNCQYEVREAEALMNREDIKYLDTTVKSIEEIATTILHQAKLVRHLF